MNSNRFESVGLQFKPITKMGRALFGCTVNPDQIISSLIREGSCLDVQKKPNQFNLNSGFYFTKNKIKFKSFWPKKIDIGPDKPNPTSHHAPAPRPKPARSTARVW